MALLLRDDAPKQRFRSRRDAFARALAGRQNGAKAAVILQVALAAVNAARLTPRDHLLTRRGGRGQ